MYNTEALIVQFVLHNLGVQVLAEAVNVQNMSALLYVRTDICDDIS